MAKGLMYDLRIWDNHIFSQDEAKELVKWTSEVISLDLWQQKFYPLNNEDKTTDFDFITSGSLHFRRRAHDQAYVTTSNWTWQQSDIAKWLERRVYNSLPHGWKQITAQPQDEYQHIWLPTRSPFLFGNSFTYVTTKYAEYKWMDSWTIPFFDAPELLKVESTQINPQENDMYINGGSLTPDNFRDLQIYRNGEWHSLIEQGNNIKGSNYWLQDIYTWSTGSGNKNLCVFDHTSSGSNTNMTSKLCVAFCMSIGGLDNV